MDWILSLPLPPTKKPPKLESNEGLCVFGHEPGTPTHEQRKLTPMSHSHLTAPVTPDSSPQFKGSHDLLDAWLDHAIGIWQLSLNAACVGTHLARMTNPHEHSGEFRAWPKQATLGERTTLGERSIRRAIAELRDKGIIDVRTPPVARPSYRLYVFNAKALQTLAQTRFDRAEIQTGHERRSDRSETPVSIKRIEQVKGTETAVASRRSLNEHRTTEYTVTLDKFRAARKKKNDGLLAWIKQRRPASDYTNPELTDTYQYLNETYIPMLGNKPDSKGKPYDTRGLIRYLFDELRPEIRNRPGTNRWYCSQ